MNITTSFIAIVSLLLALATADTATKQRAQEQSPAAAASPSKIALNHNETMVSDAPVAQDASLWSRWVTSMQAFFFGRPIPGGCDEWGCGTNHNETMASDAPLAQMNNAESVRQFQPSPTLKELRQRLLTAKPRNPFRVEQSPILFEPRVSKANFHPTRAARMGTPAWADISQPFQR